MISNWRRTFREEYSWLLLPAFLIFAFTVDNRTGVTNFMRAFCFPLVLFALTTKDYKAIWANPAARAFWLFIGWLNITLLWDGLSHKDWWFFQRNFHLFTLMGMVYLVAAYKPEKQDFVFYTYLFGGFACLMLILNDWPNTPSGLAEELNLIEKWWRWKFYTRGILTLSHYSGWLMGVLFICSLFVAAQHQGLVMLLLAGLASMFLTLVIFTQMRGIWLGLIAAIILFMTLHVRSKILSILLFFIAALSLSLLLFPSMMSLFEQNIARGDSGRLYIWRNGIAHLLTSPLSIVIGYGLSVPTDVGKHNHLHSIYLNTLSYGGLVGLTLYFRLLWQTFKKLLPIRHNSMLVAILLCMQVAFLVDGEHLFVVPSGIMLAYILPLMWAMFGFHLFETNIYLTEDKTPDKYQSIRQVGMQ